LAGAALDDRRLRRGVVPHDHEQSLAGSRKGADMPTRTLSLAAIASLTSALLLTAGLSSAGATRTVTISSHITIKGKGLTFSGNVTSSKAACKAGRKVTLYRKGSLVLGSTTTNSSGHWKI